MAYLNKGTNQYPLQEADIRGLNPNTSYATPFDPGEPYVYVFPVPQPTYNLITEVVHEGQPNLTTKGHYEQTWEIVPRFQEYTTEDGVVHTVEEQIAIAQQVADQQKQQQLIAQYSFALEQHLDVTAQSKRYDNRNTCALRAGYDGPFRAEGTAFATWMDTCNALAYTILAECMAGTREIPATPADFIALLPAISWPE